jgi:uncharacterized protein (TIGR03083 family)
MDAPGWIDSYESSALAVVEIGARNASSPVPACPGWTGHDLVGHIAQGSILWLGLVARDPEAGPPDFAQLVAEIAASRPANMAELAECTARHIRACAAKFRQTDPDTPAWTFGPPPTAAFWMRRAAMEDAVHLRDAEGMEGRRSPIPVEVAVDGIDELVDMLIDSIPSMPSYGLTVPGRSLRIEPSDTRRTWLLEGSEVRTEPAVIRGRAGDVFLALWGRDATVTGDANALKAWAGFLAPT